MNREGQTWVVGPPDDTARRVVFLVVRSVPAGAEGSEHAGEHHEALLLDTGRLETFAEGRGLERHSGCTRLA